MPTDTPLLHITKASGERDAFSEEKVRKSLRRSGVAEEQIEPIIREISGKIYDGITTKEIYRIAFGLVKKGSRPAAARYHLKKAIMELGPSGFPFEQFIAELLNHQGYTTKTDQLEQGRCVIHEIDVIAEKNRHCNLIECKFHNQAGRINDVQLPLYIQARFTDVMEQRNKSPELAVKIHQGWVVTNTRFSADAIRYGTCAGLKLLGWDYPAGAALREQIDSLGLYPVTCLTSLTKAEKQYLLGRKIVLCRELLVHKDALDNLHIKPGRLQIILTELEELCRQAVDAASEKTVALGPAVPADKDHLE